MKHLFSFVLLSILVSGCSSLSVVRKTNMDEPGTYYYLPKTILRVEIESVVYKNKRGKFSAYSEEMIGLKPHSDTVEFKPNKIQIEATAVPDDQALFLVKGKSVSVSKTSSGIISAVNQSPVQASEEKNISIKLNTEQKSEKHPVLVFHHRPPVVLHPPKQHIRKDTSAHDSVAAPVPAPVKVRQKSQAEIDYDSALVYQAKLEQLESLVHDYTDCENCEDGEATKVSLKVIKELRRSYLDLFTGSTQKNKTKQQFLVDEKTLSLLKSEKEITLNKEDLLKKNNLSITLTLLNSLTAATATEDAGFAYRIPAIVMITIRDSKTRATLATETMEVALPGTETIGYLSKKTNSVLFDKETGAVLETK